MLVPLSWIKDFVEIKLSPKDLAWKLTEAGLNVESITGEGEDLIFDFEIIPNRPDWMSVYGIAREVAAVTKAKLKSIEKPRIPERKNSSQNYKLSLKPNYEIIPRITSVIIKNVKVKSSPEWMQKRIKQIGLRPINNLVDITNYVLWEYGSLLHVFDYDTIRGHQMTITQAQGGEDFRSLDGIDYKLPKGAIIIKDVGRVIDLLCIKGGDNTASRNKTRNVLLHSVTIDPIILRRTSQALNLRSDSSAIAERGLDPNGTINAVNQALALILELAGGEVASEIMDHKVQDFKPWVVEMTHQKMEKVLGIEIEPKMVVDFLERLELKTEVRGTKEDQVYQVTVPTFRNDLHIEEDLIEEVGRLYGYNRFPKTLPASAVPVTPVPYYHDYDLDYRVKQILQGAGYHEIYSYSLVSENQLIKLAIDPTKALRVDNPVSRDYEYLRPHLIGNLIEAIKLNQANFTNIKLFELGKEYRGKTIDDPQEQSLLCGVELGEKFLEAKGTVELVLNQLRINYEITSPGPTDATNWLHPGRMATIIHDNDYLGFIGELHPTLLNRFGTKGRVTAWEIKYELLESLANMGNKYQPVPKYPAVVEDLSLIIPEKVLYGEVVETIKKTSPLVSSVDLLDTHNETTTLRLTYLDRTKNLTDKEVSEIKAKIMKKLTELKVRMK